MTYSLHGKALNGKMHCHKDPKSEGVYVQNQGDANHFFDVHKIVHAEFLPQGSTINRTSTALSKGEKRELW